MKSFISTSFLNKFLILLVVSGTHSGEVEGIKPAVFTFSEYEFKETSKNELVYREFEAACEQSTRCERLDPGIRRVKCVRECISPSCYYDIYKFNELEEGEIDVRLNSFKGCFIQRSSRSRL